MLIHKPSTYAYEALNIPIFETLSRKLAYIFFKFGSTPGYEDETLLILIDTPPTPRQTKPWDGKGLIKQVGCPKEEPGRKFI